MNSSMSAQDVAAAVIAARGPITPGEMYMLVFFTAGEYSALTALAMFPEPFEAWGHGPIVRSLWKAYERFEGERISAAVGGDPSNLGALANGCVESAISKHAGLSGADLIDLVHEEPAWKEAYASEERHPVIPTEALVQSFRGKYAGVTISDEDLDRFFASGRSKS
jgi:uncharacterized phage-associated protein